MWRYEVWQMDKHNNNKVKIKRSLLKAWTGSEGSRRLRLPDFKIIGT
jgi:hypothetical protein